MTGTRRSDKIKDVSEGTNKRAESRQAMYTINGQKTDDINEAKQIAQQIFEDTGAVAAIEYRGTIDIAKEWQGFPPYSREARDLDDECRERTGMGCHALIEGMRAMLEPA